MREINEVTTEQIREASSKGFVSSLGYRSIADNEFDYWLASVKAEAWDEGYDVGYDDCRDGGMGLRNPYREAVTE